MRCGSIHVFVFRKIGKLLELIYANDDVDTFLPCQGFRKLKNREFVFFFRFEFDIKSHEVIDLVFDNQLGDDSVEKQFCIFCPFFKLG